MLFECKPDPFACKSAEGINSNRQKVTSSANSVSNISRQLPKGDRPIGQRLGRLGLRQPAREARKRDRPHVSLIITNYFSNT